MASRTFWERQTSLHIVPDATGDSIKNGESNVKDHGT